MGEGDSMKIQILTPCEKIIQDPKTGPSLIATFQEIGISVPTSTELPTNAVVPKEWAIYAMWALEPEDQGKTFSLKFAIYWPNGDLFVEQGIDTFAALPDWVTLMAGLPAFPMGQAGKIKVAVWVECEGKVVAEPTETFIRINVDRNDQLFSIHPTGGVE
jgi:hypothetical protein